MISIITPHYEGSNPYIEEAYNSLLEQTVTIWEWVIVLNNGGCASERMKNDSRVKIFRFEDSRIGTLKSFACKQATGNIVVELDSDDMLTPNALEEVSSTFERHPEVAFVYSNFAEFKQSTWEPNQYNKYWGWKSKPWKYKEHNLVEQISMPPTPHSFRSIYWAPNHVRAWRSKDYWAIGGHVDMSVADDHDLCCRFYIHAPVYHLDKCLYLYRVHDKNTVCTRNKEIQEGTAQLYSKYIISLIETWAKRSNLSMIDLGGGFNKPTGYKSVDLVNADIIHNVEQDLPFEDSSIGIIRAYDFVEHIRDSVNLMNEIHRVLVPGGWLLLSVPSTDGRGAFQAPDHVSYWNENSIWYYTNPQYAQYVPKIKAKFQNSRTITWFPSEWHREKNISYVDSQLICIKEGYAPVGEDLWGSNLQLFGE